MDRQNEKDQECQRQLLLRPRLQHLQQQLRRWRQQPVPLLLRRGKRNTPLSGITLS